MLVSVHKVSIKDGLLWRHVLNTADNSLKDFLIELKGNSLIVRMDINRLREGLPLSYITRCKASGDLIKYEMKIVN